MDRALHEIKQIYKGSVFAELQNTNFEIMHLRQFLYGLTSGLKNKKILFIGCGDAIECIPAFNMGAEVTGIDLSESLIKIARSTLPLAKFIPGDYFNLNGSFDYIVSINSLNYESNLTKAYSKYFSLLKPGAIAYVCVPHPFYKTQKYLNGNYFWEGKKYYNWQGLGRFNYINKLSSYLNTALANGFVLKQLHEINTPAICRSKSNVSSRLPIFLLLELKRQY